MKESRLQLFEFLKLKKESNQRHDQKSIDQTQSIKSRGITITRNCEKESQFKFSSKCAVEKVHVGMQFAAYKWCHKNRYFKYRNGLIDVAYRGSFACFLLITIFQKYCYLFYFYTFLYSKYIKNDWLYINNILHQSSDKTTTWPAAPRIYNISLFHLFNNSIRVIT
jgi:hypothetical protein